MSWFSDLADKAETLLNKIDQNAAAVLQEKDKKIFVTNGGHSNENGSALNEIPVTNDSVDSSQNVNIENSKIVEASKTNRNEFKSPNKLLQNIIKKSKNSLSPTKHTRINDTSTNSKLKKDNSEPTISTTNHIEKTINISTDEIDAPSTTINNNNENKPKFIVGSCEGLVDLEKEMLQNEISVVNNELSLLLSKVKNAEKATDNTQAQLLEMEKSYSRVLSENEYFKQLVSSYKSPISSHESCDDTIKAIQEENEKLQEKINELNQNITSVVSNQNKLEMELKLSQETCLHLEEKLEKAKNENSNIMTEWNNYKIRANHTLNMKEKMIEELGGNHDDGNDAPTSTINSLNSQIVQLKTERNEVTQELTKLQSEYFEKTKEIEQLEHKTKLAEKQTSIFKEALKQEKVARETAENNVNSLNKELKSLHSETAKQISALRAKFKENKFIEMEKQMSSEPSNFHQNSMNTAESGDERVRSLTQALVAKQAALESVTADRNALRLQLEKTENKYRSALISVRNSNPQIINVNDTDDAKARFPSLLQESPWDSSLSRGVKKAYSSLDTFSVRIGVFLRRNPIARIFILSYMMILHLWVLVVLCTYTPEAHTAK